MTMKHFHRILFLLAVCGALVACTTPAQMQALAQLDEMLASGSISTEQYQGLRETLLTTGWSWVETAVNALLGTGGALGAVRLWRGPSATKTERVARKAAAA